MVLRLLFVLLQKKFYSRVRKNRFKKKTSSAPVSSSPKQSDDKEKTANDSHGDNSVTKKLLCRHAGILGLCAFVNAYPYDVPEFVPDILMFLSDYVHEPQPISVS